MATFDRVYWKQLELLQRALKRYIQRYDLQLQSNLTQQQYACVVAVLDAIIECLAVLPVNEPIE